jgi:hypothetical protein
VAIGASAILKLRSGAQPGYCSGTDSGTVIATMNLPADYMANAAAGSKAAQGTWQDTLADNAGTIGHFRIYDSGGTICHMQGTVGLSGADMNLDAVVVNAGQQITITSFVITDGNA